jgi:iron complex transport system substrate-binding protein
VRGLIILFVFFCASAWADITVRDDAGRAVRLAQPATRILSLSPDMTENLFAIGVGDRVVGTVEFSNYPPPARALPRIGGYERIDLEAALALKPDLVIAWQSGNSPQQVAKLIALGLPVYLAQPGRIEDVTTTLERLGELTGAGAAAQTVAARFAARVAALRARYGERPTVRSFYQVWDRPLTTIGGRQAISDALRLCGGENIFAHLKPLAAEVTLEAVLEADPEAIIASGMDEARPQWLDAWRRWPALTAVARNNLFFVPPDHLQRHTPRLADGITALCAHLETARARRR